MDTSGTLSVGVGTNQESQESDVAELIAELTPKQRIALPDLVVGVSVKGVAEKIGLHRGTVSRWILKDAHFNAALNALQMEAIRVGHTRLMSLIPVALMAIENAINRGDVRAALAILKHTLFARLAPAPLSPAAVAQQMQVSELQQQEGLYRQQTELEQLHEETAAKSRSVSTARWLRTQDEQRQAEREKYYAEEAAREAAEAQAKQESQRRAAAAQKKSAAAPKSAEVPSAHPGHSPLAASVSQTAQTPSSQPGKPAASSTQPPAMHPGHANPPRRDARITAAAQSVAGTLANPGITQGKPTPSPDANAGQNPETTASQPKAQSPGESK